LKQGKIIVRSGEEITRAMVAQLEALRSLQRPRSLFRQSTGFFFFGLTFIYALWR
jgi:membrane-associated HD superfamily phosphohydrolase